MLGGPIAARFDQARLAVFADWVVVALAVSLPWSTSATSILVVVWLILFVPTLTWPDTRRVLTTTVGGLPVLLVLLGALGMAWAKVPLFDRLGGLDGFLKLLVLPLLMMRFTRSDRALWVFGGYVAACVVLLLASTAVEFIPALSFIPMHHPGHVLVKNEATQSGEFVTCIFGLLLLAQRCIERRQWPWLVGLAAVILGMLANMLYLSTGRTALVIIPVLLTVFALKHLSGKGIVAVFIAAVVLAGAAWVSSPFLRQRTLAIWTDIQRYQTSRQTNSTSERLVFWAKSLEFIGEAPISGHGTGSIPALFAHSVRGQVGPAASETSNPHNQTFTVAIQIGLVGAAVLWAMWIAHLWLFRGAGLVEWVGLVLVVQNIVGSLFNTHLFDFVQGWVYVVGVGVAGGTVLGRRLRPPVSTNGVQPRDGPGARLV